MQSGDWSFRRVLFRSDGMMGEMREIKEAKGFGEWDKCPVASKCPRDSPVNTRVWADGYKGLWSSNSRLPHPKMQVGTSTSLALLAAPLLMWPGGYSHRVDPEPPRSQKLVFRVPLSRRPGAHRLAEPALVPAKSQGPASQDRKSTRLNSSHRIASRMPSSA